MNCADLSIRAYPVQTPFLSNVLNVSSVQMTSTPGASSHTIVSMLPSLYVSIIPKFCLSDDFSSMLYFFPSTTALTPFVSRLTLKSLLADDTVPFSVFTVRMFKDVSSVRVFISEYSISREPSRYFTHDTTLRLIFAFIGTFSTAPHSSSILNTVSYIMSRQ